MSYKGLVEWTEKVAEYLNQTYLPSNDAPALAETLMPSGVLLIRRQSLSEEIDIQYEENEDGLMYSLLIPEEDEALRNLLVKGVLAPAAAFQS